MEEDFEGVFPSTGWSVSDGDGTTNGEYYWDDDDYWYDLPQNSSWTAWAANGGANGVDPEYYNYPNNANSWMTYGPFDLSTYSYADVLFSYSNISEENCDHFGWYASPDGLNYYGTAVSGDSGGWKNEAFDLTNVPGYGDMTGDSSVWIAFVFWSDDSVVYSGPYVDNISLWGQYGTTSLDDWTVMVYLNADNNLESDGIDDFLEMSNVGSSSDVNIVVQFDRRSDYDTSYDNWTDTRRFLVTPGMTPSSANGTSIGEADMGDPKTLLDFAQWAMSSYPAENYALIVWDHGSGWRLSESDVTKGISYDDTNSSHIDMTELRGALATMTVNGSSPLDLFGMDACLMGMIEVDNQIKPYADVRVGSEETEPSDGWDYNAIASGLVSNSAMSSSTLGTLIVDSYYASYGNDNTQSAVYLGSEYDSLNSAVDDFSVALINSGNTYISEIADARFASQEFSDYSYIDLYDFAYNVSINISDTVINNAANAVMTAVSNAVFREQHGSSWHGAHGISIYFPVEESSYDDRYDGDQGYLEFTANTHWDEWLNTFYQLYTIPVPDNDDFDNAEVLSIDATTLANTRGATSNIDDPQVPNCDLNAGLATVWYKYTPTSDSAISIDTKTSSYDTFIAVWTGTRTNLNPVVCNDDIDYYSTQSEVTFRVQGRTTYYIEVGEFDWYYGANATGVKVEKQPPLND